MVIIFKISEHPIELVLVKEFANLTKPKVKLLTFLAQTQEINKNFRRKRK